MTIAPMSNMEAMHKEIKNSKLKFYEGGHLFLIQDKQAFQDLIDWQKINTLINKYEYQNKKNFRLFRFHTFFLIFHSSSGFPFPEGYIFNLLLFMEE